MFKKIKSLWQKNLIEQLDEEFEEITLDTHEKKTILKDAYSIYIENIANGYVVDDEILKIIYNESTSIVNIDTTDITDKDKLERIEKLQGKVSSTYELNKILEEEGLREKYEFPIRKRELNGIEITEDKIIELLGLQANSEKFTGVCKILGEAHFKIDSENNRIDYTWYQYGVNIVISDNEECIESIFLYPFGSYNDFEYIENKEPSLFLCKNECYQNLTMRELKDKYGEPISTSRSLHGYVLKYENIDGLEIHFTFKNSKTLYSVMFRRAR